VRSFKGFKSCVAVVGAAAAIVVPALVADSSAGAASTGVSTLVQVPGGRLASSFHNATALGATPASTPETVSFYFRAKGMSSITQMESVVRSVTTSHAFLTRTQVVATYGQAASVQALESYLGGFGISVTRTYLDLAVVTKGTAGEYDAALSVSQKSYHVAALSAAPGRMGVPAQTVHAATSSPKLPELIAKSVRLVVGLTNYTTLTDSVQQSTLANTTQATTSAGITHTCSGCHLPGYFATKYGLKGLYSEEDNGAGSTIAIVTLAALQPTAATDFWGDIGVTRTGTLTVTTVTGGPGVAPTSGTVETDLDTEQSGALAPGANIVVYQAPLSTAGFIDGFFAAATADVATSVSASWGEWEATTELGTVTGTALLAEAFSTVFFISALEGQSVFVSSADTGAYGRYGVKTPTVDLPGDSPFVTAAGGTTTPWSGKICGRTVDVSAQRAWGWDYLWQAIAKGCDAPEAEVAEEDHGGGGGGYSNLFQMPYYQRGVSGTTKFYDVGWFKSSGLPIVTTLTGFRFYLTWVFNPHPSLGHGTAPKAYTVLNVVGPTGPGRALPDVAADADPESGYYVYTSGADTTGLGNGFHSYIGGTSFVDPQLNGSTAVIDQALRAACTTLCTGRVGLWNTYIYTFARTKHETPFTPLSAAGANNDNLFYSGTPNTLYNPASGLGVPNLTKLEADFVSAGL
jgi:kumamolisin